MVESFFSDKLGMYTIQTSLCMCLCRYIHLHKWTIWLTTLVRKYDKCWGLLKTARSCFGSGYLVTHDFGFFKENLMLLPKLIFIRRTEMMSQKFETLIYINVFQNYKYSSLSKKKKSRHIISRDKRLINSVLPLLIKKQHGAVYVTTKQIRNCAFHSYSYKANLI